MSWQSIVPVSPWLVEMTLCGVFVMPDEKLRGPDIEHDAVLSPALKTGASGIKAKRRVRQRRNRMPLISLTCSFRQYEEPECPSAGPLAAAAASRLTSSVFRCSAMLLNTTHPQPGLSSCSF